MDQVFLLALGGRLLCPRGEPRLCVARCRFETADAEVVREGFVGLGIAGHVATGDEGYLVAQVGELIVHRRGGEQEDLGADAGLDDVLDQTLVAGDSCGLAVLATWTDGIVAEVVRLVDDDEVVVAPVDAARSEVDAIRLAALAREVGVMEDIVAETILFEGVEVVVASVEEPVVGELLRAEHQDALVFQLEVFDDSKGFESFAKTDAVSEDAAAVLFEFVDGRLGAIALKLEQSLPNSRVGKADFPQGFVERDAFLNETTEELVERLEVDELGWLISVDLEEVFEDRLLHVLNTGGVIPEFLEPLLQIGTVPVPIDDEVELHVVIGGSEAEATRREVRAAEDGGGNLSAADVRHLSVEEPGVGDGTDFDLVSHPLGAGLSQMPLIEPVRQCQAIVAEDVGGAIGLLWIDVLDKGRFTEEQANTAKVVQLGAQFVVGEDCEVGGD
ncbi:MAG: hypothetical protein BWY57_02897 [Betaproteobacteria bacterium ADurb.Bin341]|nr:MAG: hypothetical protein BWY57_02897 [Betaproteobacteria bacterium ADurb.Bin341]